MVNSGCVWQSQLCVITDGGQGCALALGGGSRVEPIRVQPYANITQIDATGEEKHGGFFIEQHTEDQTGRGSC